MALCFPADSSLVGKTHMKMNSTECEFQEAKAEELQRGRGFNKIWEASSKFGAAEAG